MPLFWQATGLVSLLLSALVVRNSLRGDFFRFSPPVVLYCGFVLLSGVPTLVAQVEPGLVFAGRREYVLFYWVSEATLQLLTFSLILGLLARLVGRRRRVILPILIAIAAGVCCATAWLNGPGSVTRLMTPMTRNMTFLATLLTFVLWVVILRRGSTDRISLLVAAGAGMLTAGKTIGHAIRWLAGVNADVVLAGNVVIVLTGLVSLWMWWYASREDAGERAARPT
jgi:hypothetical protein